MIREFKVAEPGRVFPCPRCGNDTRFRAHSMQVAEDCCEVWVECVCGYDPTENETGGRLEDVWGSLDKDTIRAALGLWDEYVEPQAE